MNGLENFLENACDIKTYLVLFAPLIVWTIILVIPVLTIESVFEKTGKTKEPKKEKTQKKNQNTNKYKDLNDIVVLGNNKIYRKYQLIDINQTIKTEELTWQYNQPRKLANGVESCYFNWHPNTNESISAMIMYNIREKNNDCLIKHNKDAHRFIKYIFSQNMKDVTPSAIETNIRQLDNSIEYDETFINSIIEEINIIFNYAPPKLSDDALRDMGSMLEELHELKKELRESQEITRLHKKYHNATGDASDLIQNLKNKSDELQKEINQCNKKIQKISQLQKKETQ